ncbi:MAG: hypothetical protein WCG90_08305 [Chitinophagia bacterium]
MNTYIITLEPIEQFDAKGKSLGMSDLLGIFYSPSIGRKRYYRQSLSTPQKGLKLLTFKSEKGAKKVCDITNNITEGGWKVDTILSTNLLK